jgi:V8-like Glu-specific endopeptidase
MRALYVLLFAFSLSAQAQVAPTAVAKAKAATVDCAPGATCSPSVGLLSFTTPNDASQCTASLVAPDIIATNGHCVPEDMRQAGASCEGRAWMNFVKSSNPDFETQLECESVLFVEKQKYASVSETPDYAFFRLKKASRRPFNRISRAGFADGEEITFEHVDPVKAEGKVYGVQKAIQCRAIQHSMLSISFTHNLAPVGLFEDCKVIFGNSGSPLIGRDGTIRGVMHAKPGVTEQSLKAKKITLTEALTEHGFGTNYACRPLPAEVNAPGFPAACAQVSPVNKSFAALDALVRDKAPTLLAGRNLGGIQGAWDELNFPKGFVKYEPYSLKFRPTCVNAAQAGAGTTVTSGPLSFQVRVIADRYLRVQSAELVPQGADNAGFALGRLENGSYRLSAEGFNRDLPPCAAGQ